MRLLFFVAVWKRPAITEICFKGLNRLKKSGLFPLDVLAVISEDSMKRLCKKYGIDYVFYKNEPLGEKKNFGLTYAMQHKKFDYLIELGSDDLLKTELLEVYKPVFGTRELFGMDHFIYLNSETGECRAEQTDMSFGMGRAMSFEMLQRCARGVDVKALQSFVTTGNVINEGNTGFCGVETAQELKYAGIAEIVGNIEYNIWHNDIMQGLDNNSNFFLAKHGAFHKRIKCENALGIDIKSNENIWPYNPELGMAIELDKAIAGLSDDEKTALLTLIKNNKRRIETASTK